MALAGDERPTMITIVRFVLGIGSNGDHDHRGAQHS